MLNLIRADVYKLLKSTSFRVCGVLFLLLAGSENFLYHLVEKMGGGTGTQTTVLSRIQGTDTSYLILLAIVISLFIGSEYTYGTIKNLASKHYERNEIFASKWIVSVLLATVYFAVSIVIVGITAAFYWKTGDLSGNVISNTAGFLFTKYILVLSITSLYVMAAFIIRKTQFVLPVAIIGLDVIGTIEIILAIWDSQNDWVHDGAAWSKHWPANMIVDDHSEARRQHAELLPGVLTGLVFLTAAAAGGVIHFKRVDIK